MSRLNIFIMTVATFFIGAGFGIHASKTNKELVKYKEYTQNMCTVSRALNACFVLRDDYEMPKK